MTRWYAISTALYPICSWATRCEARQDSAPTFFFGDTLVTSGARWSYFSTNTGNDPGLIANSPNLTWGEHMTAAAKAGVVSVLFGAGVGNSTNNVGNPPTDAFWWITKAQDYLANLLIRK